MKIVLNIEKKHLIFFGLFLVLAGGIFVIAQGGQYKQDRTPLSGVGHPDLYVDYISSWTENNPIQVNDPQGISFGIGNNPNLYSIRATANTIRYGNENTANVFEGKICSSYTDGRNNDCKTTSEILSGTGGESVMRIIGLWPDGTERNVKLDINQIVIKRPNGNWEIVDTQPECNNSGILSREYGEGIWQHYKICGRTSDNARPGTPPYLWRGDSAQNLPTYKII